MVNSQIFSNYSGQCQCGKTRFDVALPEPLKHYIPRQCDCDFCVHRGIAYLSDPQSEITVSYSTPCSEYTQGSEQARFLTCSECDDVVAVCCQISGDLRGAVNASLLKTTEQTQTPQQVSPKHLTSEEKRLRWSKVWGRIRMIKLCDE